MDKINKNDNRLFTKSKTNKRLTPWIYKKLLQNKIVNPNRKMDNENNLKGSHSWIKSSLDNKKYK